MEPTTQWEKRQGHSGGYLVDQCDTNRRVAQGEGRGVAELDAPLRLPQEYTRRNGVQGLSRGALATASA